jgi:hypothetical protein
VVVLVLEEKMGRVLMWLVEMEVVAVRWWRSFVDEGLVLLSLFVPV